MRSGEESMMSSATFKLVTPAKVLVLLLAACLPAPLSAIEPVEEFAAALRAERLYQEALDYLQMVDAKAGVPAALKQQLPYERGLTLAEAADVLADPAGQEAQLSLARQAFEQFLKDTPGHALAVAARDQLAAIDIQRARLVIQSARDGGSKEKLASARSALAQARKELSAAEKEYDAQLAELPKLIPPEDTELQAKKRRLSDGLAQVKLRFASVDFELAGTYEPASAEAKQHLKAAAASYAALFEDYRTRMVGLVARMSEGRCYQQLGQYTQALGCFIELMELPPGEDTNRFKTRGTRYAMECWTKDGQDRYQEAIEAAERWERELGGGQTDADALAIRYLAAVAYQGQAKSLPAKDPNRKRLVGAARQSVGAVAQQPGEFQRPAKMMLVALADGKKEAKAKRPAGPANFAEAFEQAREALEKMQATGAQLEAARREGKQKEVPALEAQKAASAKSARELLRLALDKSDEKTPIEDLNSARYYLCFLAWDAGEYYDAAVLGEFLATHYPDTPSGQQGAKIALAAFVRLLTEAPEGARQFEQASLERIAGWIFKRWPNQVESDEAALTLLNLAASQHDVDRAMGFLEKISKDSPRRGGAELRAGQSLWASYLRASRATEDQRLPQEKLDAMKTRAQDVLAQGIARVEKSGDIDPSLITAVLSMAQICVETGQADKAIGWLEHAKYGPLTLIKAKNPVASRDAFANETYKMALRAYIAASPQQLEKAEQAMDALEKLSAASGDAKSGEGLTAIYISLGRELGQHLEELRKAKKFKELESVSKAFEVFLDRVTKRETGDNYASLNWVADTYSNLGRGLQQEGLLPPPQAKTYFHKAGEAYQRMLTLAASDPKYKDQPDALIALRMRTADCQQRGGDFEKAIQTLVGVLKEKPTLLTAQIQAAETYQAMGLLDPKGYAMSITGGAPGLDGKNVVWGWSKLSKMTSGNSKFQEQFHQARLNMAQARMQYGLVQDDAAKKAKILEAAKQDLWFTYKLHPDLGGEATTARYDRLLKQIQKHQGAKEIGLAEFKQRDEAPPAPSS